MTRVPLCTANLYKQVKAGTKTKFLRVPKDLAFEMFIHVPDELHEQIENDAVLASKIFSGVSREFNDAVNILVRLVHDIESQIDSGAVKKNRRDYAEAEWDTRAPDILDSAQAKMESHARKAIQKWQSVRKDRKKYVIKAAAKVTVGTLGVAAATLGTALSATSTVATGGAAVPGLIAAIYGNLKAIIQLGKVINRLRRDIDAAEAILKKDLDSLVQAYNKNGKGAVASKELAKAALDQFLAVTVASISSAENSMSDFKGKLDGLDIKLSEMAIKLNKVITEQGNLETLIAKKLQKEMNLLGYKSKKLPGLLKTRDKLESMTRDLLRDTSAMMEKVADGRDRYTNDYKKSLELLKAKKPGWVDHAQMALKLGDIAICAGFTSYDATDSVIALVDSIGVEFTDVLAEKVL